MQIEPATIADAPGILALQYLAYQSEAELYNDPLLPPLTQTLDALRAEFTDHIVLKATIDETIVGSVRAHIRDGAAYVGRLCVHPDFQNQGIGAELMRAIEQACGEADRLELFTGYKSERNLYLYRKLGYQEVRRERVDDSVTLIYLEKRVR